MRQELLDEQAKKEKFSMISDEDLKKFVQEGG